MTFEQWLEKVNAIIESKVGLSYQDLPDCSYHDWYDEGVSPSVAAKRAIRLAKEG